MSRREKLQSCNGQEVPARWAPPARPGPGPHLLIQGSLALLQSVPLDLVTHFLRTPAFLALPAPAFPLSAATASASSGQSLAPGASLLPFVSAALGPSYAGPRAAGLQGKAWELSPRPLGPLVSALGTHLMPPPLAGLPDQTRTLLRWHQFLDPGLCTCHQAPSCTDILRQFRDSGQHVLGSTSTRNQTLSRFSCP